MTTNEQLRKYADDALRAAQHDLTHDGEVTPRLWFEGEPGKLKECPLGPFAEWLNEPDKKRFLFRVISKAASQSGIDCFMFMSEAWVGESTAKALALGVDAFMKRVQTAKQGMLDLIAEGLVTRTECIVVSVHSRGAPTPLMVRQPFVRDDKLRAITFGEKTIMDPSDPKNGASDVRSALGFVDDKATQ